MKLLLCGLAAILIAAGCSSNADTPEAVKRGIINDLSKRMDVKTMDVSVDSVSFRDREADAVVTFAPKGVPRSRGTSMSMRYKLQRTGNEWRIASRSSGDLARHSQTGGAQGPLPEGHPAVNGVGGATGDSLPPGHPAIPPGQSQ